MRKLLTLFLLCFLNCHLAWAQTEATETNRYNFLNSGVKAGVNYSNIAGSAAYLGFHGGLYGEIRESGSFGYSGELLFSHQGGRSGGSNLTLNYLTLPIMANLHAGKTTFQAGPYAALLLSANTGARNVTGALKASDLGVTGGLKTMISERIGLGVRYYHGLQEISEITGTWKNRNLQLSLYYAF